MLLTSSAATRVRSATDCGVSRIAELYDRLASPTMAADTRSRFIRLMAASAGSTHPSQPVFAAGLPALSLGLHLPPTAAAPSAAAPQPADTLRAIGNTRQGAFSSNADAYCEHAAQPGLSTENSPASQVCTSTTVCAYWLHTNGRSHVSYLHAGARDDARPGCIICLSGHRRQISALAARGMWRIRRLRRGRWCHPSAGGAAADASALRAGMALQVCAHVTWSLRRQCKPVISNCCLTRTFGMDARQLKCLVEAGMSGQGGVVRQAFCGFLDQELRDYYRLMAILEAQTRQLLPGYAKGKESNKT